MIIYKIKRQLKYSLGLNPKAKELVDDDIKDIVMEISQFTGQQEADVWAKARREASKAGTLVAEAWNEANPQSSKAIEEFYQKTDAYLYDLPIEHQRGLRVSWEKDLIKLLNKLGAETIFDFGGGTGEDAMHFAKNGLKTTYYDLPGKTYDFACWRFKQRSLPIKTTNKLTQQLEGKFDSLVSIEVLEHVNDPVATVDQMRKLVRVGGNLILSESFTLLGQEYPSHIEGRENLHQVFIPTLEALGLKFKGYKGPDLRWYLFERIK